MVYVCLGFLSLHLSLPPPAPPLIPLWHVTPFPFLGFIHFPQCLSSGLLHFLTYIIKQFISTNNKVTCISLLLQRMYMHISYIFLIIPTNFVIIFHNMAKWLFHNFKPYHTRMNLSTYIVHSSPDMVFRFPSTHTPEFVQFIFDHPEASSRFLMRSLYSSFTRSLQSCSILIELSLISWILTRRAVTSMCK